MSGMGGEKWKGRRILLCRDCRTAAGKARALGITFVGTTDQLHCAGSVATRSGTWEC